MALLLIEGTQGATDHKKLIEEVSPPHLSLHALLPSQLSSSELSSAGVSQWFKCCQDALASDLQVSWLPLG